MMAEIRERVLRRARRVRARYATPNRSSRASGEGDLRSLRSRVRELEREVMENRQLARRIAELTDVVEQLLLPEDVRDTSRLEERLGQIRTRR